MAGGLPPLFLEIRAKFGEALSQLRELGSEAEHVGAQAEKGGSRTQAAYDHLASAGKIALTSIAGASVAVGVEAFKMADEMSESDAHIAGSAQISVKAAQSIGDAFLKTAGQSTFSGKEMADAFGPAAGIVQQLAGHALNAGDSMKYMSAANDLAEASGEPLQQVTMALAQTMQAYGLKLGDAAEASNTMFNISRLTGVGISELASTVQKLHGRLGVAAPDLTTVGSLMLDLQKHGIAGSRGVMVAQTALTTLLAGSKKTAGELKTLGVSVYDSSGKFIGMQAVIAALAPKLAKMTDAQRLQAEVSLFGTSAGTAMNATIMAGADAYTKATTAVSAHDAVQKAAEASANSLHGQIDKLKSGFEDIVTLLGEKLVPIVMAVVTWFTKHKTITLTLAAVIGGVLAAAIGAYVSKLVWGAAQTVGRLAVMVAGWAGLGPASTAAAAETTAAMGDVEAAEGAMAASSEAAGEAASAAFGPIGLAIAGVIVVATLLVTHWRQVWGWIKTAASDAWNDVIKPVFRFIEDDAIKPAIFAAQTMQHVFEAVWDGINAAISGAWNDVIKPVFDFIRQNWGLLLAALTGGLSLLIQHWRQVWGAVEAVAKTVWDDVLKPVWDAIINYGIHPIVDEVERLGRGFARIWGGIEAVVRGAWNDVLKPVFGFVNQYGIEPIRLAVQEFGQIWFDIWNGVQTVVQDVWNIIKPIIDGIKDAVGGVTHVVGSIINGVGGAIGDVGSFFSSLDSGGATPGSVGQPSLAVIHGGEFMLSNPMLTGKTPVPGSIVGAVLANAARNPGTLASLAGAARRGGSSSQALLLGGTSGGGAGGGGTQVLELHNHTYLDGKQIAHTVERQQLRTGMRRGTTYQPYQKA